MEESTGKRSRSPTSSASASGIAFTRLARKARFFRTGCKRGRSRYVSFFGFYVILVYRSLSVFDTIVAIMAVNRKAFKFRSTPTTQSRFKCVECGYTENADLVGALNVLARGHRVIACGVKTLVLTMKQEPLGSSDTRPILAA